MIWYKDNFCDITVSTRIRLARNLDGTPFPNALRDKAEVIKRIRSAIEDSHSTLAGELEYIDLGKLKKLQRQALEEEHLISPQMLDGKDKAVFISKDKTMSIMLMEEDHIRLQVILAGNEADKAYDLANKIDDVLEESLTYAFDEDFGYLTACPTNAGTGLRVSLMMHLPALTMTRNIERVINSAGNMGIAVRGLYGEGTRADGNFYQISNQVTMGLTEKQIIEKVKAVSKQIEDMEKKAREALKEKSLDELTDKVYRSFGTLKYARSISSAEAKSLLSDVMLGKNMGIIKEKVNLSPIEGIVSSEPSVLCRGLEELPPDKRDRCRAEMLRKAI